MTFFADGFESGNLSAWTATFGSPSVQSGLVHRGGYALLSPSGSNAYCYKNITAGSPAMPACTFAKAAIRLREEM